MKTSDEAMAKLKQRIMTLLLTRFPPRLQRFTVRNLLRFDWNVDTLDYLIQRAIDCGNRGASALDNIYIGGPAGVGKTQLMHVLALCIADAGLDSWPDPLRAVNGVRFVSGADLPGRIRDLNFRRPSDEGILVHEVELDRGCGSAFSNPKALQSETEVMNFLVDVEVLFIDDPGTEKETPGKGGILFRIINARYAAGRPTILSTNYSLKDAVAVGILGVREADRFTEADQVFYLDGPTLRRNPDVRKVPMPVGQELYQGIYRRNHPIY